MKQPGVESAVAFPGLSINGFTNSVERRHRLLGAEAVRGAKGPSLNAVAIAQNLNKKYAGIQDAFIAMLPPPPVNGLGTTGGFKLQIEDRAGLGYEALDAANKAFMAKAMQAPELTGLFSSYQVNVPQLYADIDRTRARQLGVPVTSVLDTMQIYLGSLYVNDFNKFGRTYSVRVQADAKFRARVDDIGTLKVQVEVRRDGAAVGAAAGEGKLRSRTRDALQRLPHRRRQRRCRAGLLVGTGAGCGRSASLRRPLPKGISFEWTDLTYQEIIAGNSSLIVFPVAIFLVFLVLAALYESLTLPLSIIMIVPMGLLAAMFGVWVTAGDNNVFTQIGLIVLVGLSAKNAILIVEFARELEFAGRTPVQAAIEASRLRLRPILMTSMAFVMGVVPLVVSTGAGSEMRHAMGVAVFAGMIGVTAFGIFLTPAFYVLLRAMTGNRPLVQHGTMKEAERAGGVIGSAMGDCLSPDGG